MYVCVCSTHYTHRLNVIYKLLPLCSPLPSHTRLLYFYLFYCFLHVLGIFRCLARLICSVVAATATACHRLRRRRTHICCLSLLVVTNANRVPLFQNVSHVPGLIQSQAPTPTPCLCVCCNKVLVSLVTAPVPYAYSLCCCSISHSDPVCSFCICWSILRFVFHSFPLPVAVVGCAMRPFACFVSAFAFIVFSLFILHAHMYMYVCVCMYVHICMYICIYTNVRSAITVASCNLCMCVYVCMFICVKGDSNQLCLSFDK